jgi:RNA polymerase sigma-70 factor (ECF subfamily)
MGKMDSKEKLTHLMDTYSDLVFSVCLKMTGDYFTAEDITQETFITAYQHLNRFDGQNPKAWLCKIAANRCIDHLKAAGRREVATLQEEMPAVSDKQGPLDECVNQSILEKLKISCRSLPPPYDEVATDYFVNELTAKEIADKRKCPLKTTQTHIYRAREMLKRSIRKEDLLT